MEQRKSYWLELLVLGGIGLAALLFALSRGIQISPKDVLIWLGSLFSTFVGALLAFTFNNMKSERERLDKEVVAGNLALSTVAEFWDRQTQFQREIVNLYRGRDDAWLNMAVGTGLHSVEISLSRSDIAFLLEKKGSVWQQIIMEERRYRLLAKLINERHEIILNEAWPRMVAAGIQMGGAIELPQLHASLVRQLFNG